VYIVCDGAVFVLSLGSVLVMVTVCFLILATKTMRSMVARTKRPPADEKVDRKVVFLVNNCLGEICTTGI